MGILTFDWNQIAYIGSPLIVPWWAEVHIMIGFVLMYWLVVPILYYSNVSTSLDPGSFPIPRTNVRDLLGLALRAFPRNGPIALRPVRQPIQRNPRPQRRRQLLQPNSLRRVLAPLPHRKLRHDLPPRLLAHDVYSRAHGAVPRLSTAQGNEEDEDGGRRHPCEAHEVLP